MFLPFHQHELTVQRAIPIVSGHQDKASLFQHLYTLTDIVLDGCRTQLDSIKEYQQKQSLVGGGETDRYVELLRRYERQRNALILPFSESINILLVVEFRGGCGKVCFASLMLLGHEISPFLFVC